MRHMRKARGFTFLELMVSLALGMLVIGAGVKIFSQGVDATWVVSQRAEMQQDLRAVQTLVTKDISLAGAGLISGQGIALATSGTSPVIGCDQLGVCPPNGAIKYPCAPGGGCVPTLYGIMPGPAAGIAAPGSPTKTDTISVVYSDTFLALNCYSATFVKPGNTVVFTGPANPPPGTCIMPPGLTYPQPLDSKAVGLQPGDLILFTNSVGSAVGEVTNVAAGGGTPPTYTITFADNDPLRINQAGQSNDLTTISGFTVKTPNGPSTAGTVANRISVITYFLKVNPDPIGVTAGTPVLMRQVNGLTAVPAAENVVNMQFTYDTYDTAGDLLNESNDPGQGGTVSLNLIRKINVAHLAIRSQMAGTRSALQATSGFQGYDVQTSISARNLSYQNRYTFGP